MFKPGTGHVRQRVKTATAALFSQIAEGGMRPVGERERERESERVKEREREGESERERERPVVGPPERRKWRLEEEAKASADAAATNSRAGRVTN
jgi:hypothetical protein